MLVCLMIGDVHFEHLRMVMPTTFLRGMVVVNKKYEEDDLKMFEYPVPS